MRVELTEEMLDAACVAISMLRQTARWPDEFAPRDHMRVALTAALYILPRGCDHVWGARTPPGNPHGAASAYCTKCGEQPNGPIYAEPVFDPTQQHQAILSHSFSVYDPGPTIPGSGWFEISTAPTVEQLIVVGNYNAKMQWCADVWSTTYLREEQSKHAAGMYRNSLHLGWLPTHWFPMPVPPGQRSAE